MNTVEGPKIGLSGKVVSWEVVNSDGSIADACYTPGNNLILDVGLDAIGSTDYITSNIAYLALGTGTSASDVSMTTLESETTYGGTTRPPASGYPAYNAITIPAADADPFVIVYQIGIQTALAKLNGTFTELGFGASSGRGSNLFSRFRIVDSGGLPTSVTVASDQQLRLKYQLNVRVLPIEATAYQCAITGYDDTFDYEACWQGITETATYGSSTIHNVIYGLFTAFGTLSADYLHECVTLMTTPLTFQPLTTAVTASGTISSTYSRDAYVPGSYTNYVNYTFTTLESVGNIYGIGLTRTYYDGWGGHLHYLYWMAVFDSPINKPDTHNLAFKLKFTWGRDV